MPWVFGDSERVEVPRTSDLRQGAMRDRCRESARCIDRAGLESDQADTVGSIRSTAIDWSVDQLK